MKHLIIIFLLQFCSVVYGQDTLVIQERNSDTVHYSDSSGYISLTLDPKNYYYQYDSSIESLIDNFDKGFIDTFSVANNRFRIRAYSGDCCIVETFDANYWQKNFSFEISQYEYDTSKDINGDGYNDFVSYWKWFGDVHLFNPKENKFFDSANCTVGYDWTLLDTSKKIYCDLIEGNLMGQISSRLYTFRDYKRVDLFNLNIIVDKDGNDFPIKKEVLYAGNGNTNKIAEMIPKEKISIDDFDYKEFWKQRYKELLNYR